MLLFSDCPHVFGSVVVLEFHDWYSSSFRGHFDCGQMPSCAKCSLYKLQHLYLE